MMLCDVCGERLSHSYICPHCGFDNYAQYEHRDIVYEDIRQYVTSMYCYDDETILLAMQEIFGILRDQAEYLLNCGEENEGFDRIAE